ncbi:hypothetical protein DAEQUDRAFT_675221 [Daedalea quercina L-15889]|uniref:RING-type E3 ubiquitin transferase n=1 Tax=Daedalea quercina L-15889 TaxID=1314783 RepID=A0A165MYJ7_9APHY|nr:hypothetical protein DAEQUDRAFT_675221 [Daedalea quercina L-15889]
MTSRRATTPPAKRVKLESRSPSRSPNIVEISPPAGQYEATKEGEEVVEEEHCSICLQSFADRTVIPACSHEFCFECLLIWTEQSRKCPLCSQPIGDYLIHRIRSKFDYQKHFLAPLRTSARPQSAAAAAQRDARRRARTRREREWDRRQREVHEEADELERAIEKRRWVYRHHLYAKHVASNPYTRYRPFPTPAQFSASQDLISRATVFLRRELRVWVGLDVEVSVVSISVRTQASLWKT